MAMDMTKLNDFRTIMGVIVLIGGVAAWAADTRYVTKDGLTASEVRSIQRRIQILRLDKAGASPVEKEKLDNKIKFLEDEIKKLEGK